MTSFKDIAASPEIRKLLTENALQNVVDADLFARAMTVESWPVILGGVVIRHSSIVRELAREASNRYKTCKHQNPRIDFELRLANQFTRSSAWHIADRVMGDRLAHTYQISRGATKPSGTEYREQQHSAACKAAGKMVADAMVESKMMLRRPFRPDPLAIEAWLASSLLALGEL